MTSKAYRSERSAAEQLEGLERVWKIVDTLERQIGMTVTAEVMAGTSYRRQLAPEAEKEYGRVDYLLQTVLAPKVRTDGRRKSARFYLGWSMQLLEKVSLYVPGQPQVDNGGLTGLDPATSELAFGSTGSTEDDVLYIYPPWMKTRWQEAGKTCIFFCGIAPPQPKLLTEEHPVRWDVNLMRKGHVPFQPTPEDLLTY